MNEAAITAHQPEPGIWCLQLQRPEFMNALDVPALKAAHALLDDVLKQPHLKVLVLSAHGRGFCAGLDLKSLQDADGRVSGSVESAMELQRLYSGLMLRLRQCPAPVIAAVQGAAVGAGMALALACDVRFATAQASFHVGAVKIGLSAGECGLSYHLPRLVGAGRAFEIMLTGRPIAASEALQIGLVSELVEPAALLDRAMACARQICELAPYSVTATKQVMWRNLDAHDLEQAVELENQVQVVGLMTEDFAEGVHAFVQKRAPQWKIAQRKSEFDF
jgi:enoyl-CoA hydratase